MQEGQNNLPVKTPESQLTSHSNATKLAQAKRGKTSKAKGHQAERNIALDFRNIGFDKACTTRLSSRQLDSCGIDVDNIPVIIQSKAGKQNTLNPMTELQSMEEKMYRTLPDDSPWFGKPMAVVQSLPCSSNKRTKYDTKVSMTFEDFMKLVALAYPRTGLNNNDSK